MSKKRAVILDRDGVLIEDKNYAYKIEELELLPGVIEGLKLLKPKFLFFIVTNQSGIGKRYYSVEDFQNYNNYLLSILEENQIKIQRTFFCPHLKEENCQCRKPNLKFINEIRKGWNIDLNKSWMIGDHPSDILFGINGGCKTTYMSTGHGEKHLKELKSEGIKPNIISSNFLDAAKEIIDLG